uniref:VAN3-binding protein-like auxin canalisation domain-containing protein n=1 Tax=Arundo donax TaxID=35708 RepID=A0A0A9HVP2_ARUDO
MASAAQLLASHCAEMAQLTGAGHELVASAVRAVRSAVDVTSPGDLMTLTAAAATGNKSSNTVIMLKSVPFHMLFILILNCMAGPWILKALRGAATLKQRLWREMKSNASVSPCEKAPFWTPDIWCKEGELKMLSESQY